MRPQESIRVECDFVFYAIEENRGFDPEHKVYIMTGFPWRTDERHSHRNREVRWGNCVLG
ncbi:MAG: hypothetical protein COB74_05250 [Shewanella sp.]|nr:MAG: hypothetical protein COB74_05250 [Shewanella sp.]